MSLFTTVKKAKIRKTAFNLSHERKQTLEMGKLTPILCEEVVPGDKFYINTDIMVKLAPMVFPIMHRIDVYIHYFFVPNRIIWTGWEEFITGEAATTVPTFTMSSGSYAESNLLDHLGINVANDVSGSSVAISQLPIRAYYSIWNEYYRDQNLQTAIDIHNLSSGWYTLKYRSWAKDYFTSALPWAQKGSAVTLPGDVTYKDKAEYYHDPVSTVNAGDITGAQSAGDTQIGNFVAANGGTPYNIAIDNIDEVQIDINELRTAVRLQRWLERNARAGTRYTEHLLAHWGVRSKDASLQRPEFLGGGKTPIVVSEVLQTSETSGSSYLGTPAGHGIGVGRTNKAVKYCEEHGWIMAIASIVPKPAYYQGLHKKFFRSVNTDFYYPEFATLGEQEVLNKELYNNIQSSANNESTFGYQSRYAEYKYAQDSVHGAYKNLSGLGQFHLGRTFSSLPALNEQFISLESEAPDLEARIFAVGRDADPFWCQIYHNIKAIRPMPYYGTPSLI